MARSADYDLGEFTFPRGWFVVAESSAVGRRPHNVRYFGQDVVIFRGESGAVSMLEAYCPHMGTHFGRSTASWTVVSGGFLEGDSIRCPFHGWRFGPDGKCNQIPYFDGPIPEKARVRSWPIVERYGIVFCWNDPEGLDPDFDIPEYPEWDDPEWMRWSGLDHLGDLPCHPIEIFDNNSDYAHLNYCHAGMVRRYENEIDGHFYYQRQSLASRHTGADDAFRMEERRSPALTTVNRYAGPGLNSARFIEAQAAQLIATTPVDDGVARLWQCTMMKAPQGVDDDKARELLRALNENMRHGLAVEDGEIWANKRPAIRIMQLPTDGPFRQARVWYSQFFNPRNRAEEILKGVRGRHCVRGVPTFSEMAAE